MNSIFQKIIMFTLLFLCSNIYAQSSQERRMDDATDVLDQILRIPEQSVPPALLSRAYAIAVFPNVKKIGA